MITAVNKNQLKFSPTVKVINIESDSPGTRPSEIIVSCNPDDLMDENQQESQQKNTQADRPSCSYSPVIMEPNAIPKGIMKSSPKLVKKIYQQPIHEQNQATTLDDSSADDYPVLPPIKQIEVVYLDSTKSTANIGEQDNSQTSQQAPPETRQVELEEEREPVSIFPAKSSISSLHASDFYSPEEF